VSSLPKQLLGTKLTGVWATGASKQIGTPFISATIEASNIKVGTQLGFVV